MNDVTNLRKAILKYRNKIIKGYSKRHFCSLNSAEIKIDRHINELDRHINEIDRHINELLLSLKLA